ncbi:hypothetical protein GOP47_0018530 [Adiantum capillus-veneris]|uniref:Uncharacterized protein n=1 Tax=Adiantum capillus-veneris TaxID=13818 RepID=A0A9D4ZAT0_ADICA|nr:hypothetical protein GOP47_0018530 [Adiantum capillus-veneris]
MPVSFNAQVFLFLPAAPWSSSVYPLQLVRHPCTWVSNRCYDRFLQPVAVRHFEFSTTVSPRLAERLLPNVPARLALSFPDIVTLDSAEEGKLGLQLDTAPQTRIPASSSTMVLNIDSEGASLALPVSPEEKQGVDARRSNGALWFRLSPNAAGSPLDDHCQTSQTVLRASASSLPNGKDRFHAVQKGAGVGKHANSRGVGRANKLAQLEVAAEHIGASSHRVLLSSPRLLRSPGRKKSPIRWFPRKKTESYLERKIRMLQEKDGKVASLDETLGAANLHLSRIEREKLAAQAAATEAMNLRKGALVEASWCRILKLAGIPCKPAILELQKAEKKATSALAEAEKHGVILHHGPPERESSSEAVTASLDTAFDVDKEVTAAIKAALSHVSTTGEGECDIVINRSSDAATEGFSEAESQSDPETKEECIHEGQLVQDASESPRKSLSSRSRSQKQDKHGSLASVMVSRISDLSLEHQTALAGIVATRGLSELLKNQSLEQELNEKHLAELSDCKAAHNLGSLNESSDLGSILVKHVSRLQREVQAAKDTSRHSQVEGEKRSGGRLQRVAHVEGLDQILVKHVSKLEKEKLAAAQASRKMPPLTSGLAESPTKSCMQNEPCKEIEEHGHNSVERDRKTLLEVTNTPYCSTSLDSILVKHVSVLEKEKRLASKLQEFTTYTDTKAANVNNLHSECGITNDVQGAIVQPDSNTAISSGRNCGSDTLANEWIPNDSQLKCKQRPNSSDIPGLGSILVKHVSRLEKEKQMALLSQDVGRKIQKPKHTCEVGLGDMLVKRLSRLEIEKAKSLESRENEFENDESSCPATLQRASENDKTGQAAHCADPPWRVSRAQKSRQLVGTWGGPSMLHEPPSIRSNASRRKSLREKQLEEAWGGVSLGTALKRHVSKLEKEQAVWRRAEEEARQRSTLQR